MLQLYPVYLLWNRRKTLTGSPDPTRAKGANKPCIIGIFALLQYENELELVTSNIRFNSVSRWQI